jgi:branched-chain amino acid transport system permease protein
VRRALKDAGAGTAVIGLPLAIVALVTVAAASPSQTRVVVSFLITVALAVGLQTFSGNSGIVSFGHITFMGIGAYVAALLTIPTVLKQTQLPDLPGFIADTSVGYVPAIVIAIVVCVLVAVVIGGVLSRMREGAMAMATIGVLFIFYNVFDNWDAVTRGASGVYGVPQSTTVWTALVFAVIAIAAALWFRSSSPGMQLRASAADPLAASSLGSRVVRLRFIAWLVSAAILGMGGAVWAGYNLAFDPSQFYLTQTFNLLAIVTVGGLASVSGVVTGAAAITIVNEVMRRVEEATSITGLTQMSVAQPTQLVLNRRPAGLLGPVELHRRLTARRRSADEGAGGGDDAGPRTATEA